VTDISGMYIQHVVAMEKGYHKLHTALATRGYSRLFQLLQHVTMEFLLVGIFSFGLFLLNSYMSEEHRNNLFPGVSPELLEFVHMLLFVLALNYGKAQILYQIIINNNFFLLMSLFEQYLSVSLPYWRLDCDPGDGNDMIKRFDVVNWTFSIMINWSIHL
jgi:hypothetical protein